VLALEGLGVRIALGLTSTGSLDPDLRPGDVVVPDDYLSRHAPPTFCEDEPLHIVPELDPVGRGWLLEAARSACQETGGQVRDGGVYAETRGPRFETKAEIRSLARDATIVGMTLASEATLFQERGIPYAGLCVVDNWANGLGVEPLSMEGFRRQQAANGALVRRILANLLELWHSDSRP
jgi:5'-methylthioadenosine phosphorylase